MSVNPDHLKQIESVCESVCLLRDGNQEYVFFKQLKVCVGGVHHVVDAILCPSAHSGYTTRLFLSQPFPVKAANWTVHQILGRVWHTWSWQGVPADISLLQILLSHLDALK